MDSQLALAFSHKKYIQFDGNIVFFTCIYCHPNELFPKFRYVATFPVLQMPNVMELFCGRRHVLINFHWVVRTCPCLLLVARTVYNESGKGCVLLVYPSSVKKC